MSAYKMPFDQYKRLQKMSKNEFSRWCEHFGKNMWEQGYQDAHKGMQEIPENARIIDTTDTVIIDMDYDELYNIIRFYQLKALVLLYVNEYLINYTRNMMVI